MIQYGFYLLSICLMAAAGYFYVFDGDPDRVFMSVILACAAFFVGYRVRLKSRLKVRPDADTSEVAD